jgi:phage portal protein BeeE
MTLLGRVSAELAGRRMDERKGFSQPPFWSSGDPWLSMSAPWSTPDRERIGHDYEGYVIGAYKANGIVFACSVARQLVFSEARFQWQALDGGRPGDLFGSPELSILEVPAPGQTTGELLAWMDAYVTVAGNAYVTTTDDDGRYGAAASGPTRRLARLRPDWVTLVIGTPRRDGSPYDPDARVVALLYEPPRQSGVAASEPVVLLPSEVAHYSPHPDPEAHWRGMSWLTPVLREVAADKATTRHKEAFFTNGATLNTVVKFDKDVTPTAFQTFVEKFKESHRGPDKAYETLFLGGGADVTVVGADLRQLDFKATQGAGETRIAAAARVHPVIAGLSEGMQGSSLNAGNYGAAKRAFVDGTMRPFWRMAAASLANLVTPPRTGCRLWYDARDIPFLREDAKDEASIRQTDAMTIGRLTDAGFEPDAVIEAVTSGDLRLLVGRHSGLFSVQLQPPGNEEAT